MKKALQDVFFTVCMLTVGFTCIFAEAGTPTTRTMNHIGGGLWLIVSGGIIGERLRERYVANGAEGVKQKEYES